MAAASAARAAAAGANTEREEQGVTIIISLLGVPTLQALARVFEMSLSEGTPLQGEGGWYRIDIGETFRSMSMFFSIKDLHFSSLDSAIRNEIIADVLNSAHQVLCAGDEFNYPLVCGCVSHLLVHFADVMVDMSTVVVLLHHIVQLIFHAKHTDSSRNILTMGIVHIFCRCPALVASALGSLTLTGTGTGTGRDRGGGGGGGGNGLAFMIDTWFELHPLLESTYNRHISTLGLLHVLELYLLQGVGEVFLCRVLQLVVQAVGAREQDTEEVGRSGRGVNTEICMTALCNGELCYCTELNCTVMCYVVGL